MKHLLKTTIPFAAVILLAACGSNEGKTAMNHDHASMEHHDQSAMEHNSTTSNPVLKNDKLNAVYQHYINLTKALTNSDVADAKVAANAIEAGTHDLKGGASVASSANKITNASNIDEQRTAYAQMSKAMEALIKEGGLSSGAMYVEYCPMAFNHKGATWISNSKDIRNPYFGEKMMNCGEVQETIQ